MGRGSSLCGRDVRGRTRSAPRQTLECDPKGRVLSRMTWVEAKAALTPDTVVVIPLGAGSKEHGPHLPLDTDLRAGRVLPKPCSRRVRRGDRTDDELFVLPCLCRIPRFDEPQPAGRAGAAARRDPWNRTIRTASLLRDQHRRLDQPAAGAGRRAARAGRNRARLSRPDGAHGQGSRKAGGDAAGKAPTPTRSRRRRCSRSTRRSST